MKRCEDENRAVFYDAKDYPMVFNSIEENIQGEDYQVTTNKIELSVDYQQAGVLIFNYLFNPFFAGFIDGKKTELTPVNNIHFSISVPEGKHQIEIRYKDPYLFAGTYCALALLMLTNFVWIIRRVLHKNSI